MLLSAFGYFWVVFSEFLWLLSALGRLQWFWMFLDSFGGFSVLLSASGCF